jgi:DNA-binding response OmpR family regulator
MPTHVLILDPNEAFATMLKEGLEADAEYRAETTSDGDEALAALKRDSFDLLIVDLGIEDPDPIALLRQLPPELPVVVIPLNGDQIPQELMPFDIRAALAKPFFMPELPARVAKALGRTPPPVAPPAAIPQPEPSATNKPARAAKKVAALILPRISLARYDPQVSSALRELAEGTNAEAVLLLEDNKLLDHAGRLSESDTETLTKNLPSHNSPDNRTKEQMQFSQPIPDGGEYLLYSILIAERLQLTIAARPDASLRTIRTHARQTAATLVTLGQPS